MAFIEVHATLQGVDIPTKKRLKELINSPDASHLRLDSVSPFNDWHGYLPSLTEGTTLQVTGPHPWTKRNWWANIKIVNGKIKVS